MRPSTANHTSGRGAPGRCGRRAYDGSAPIPCSRFPDDRSKEPARRLADPPAPPKPRQGRAHPMRSTLGTQRGRPTPAGAVSTRPWASAPDAISGAGAGPDGARWRGPRAPTGRLLRSASPTWTGHRVSGGTGWLGRGPNPNVPVAPVTMELVDGDARAGSRRRGYAGVMTPPDQSPRDAWFVRAYVSPWAIAPRLRASR